MGLNGHPLPKLEDEIARQDAPDLADTDADDLERRAGRITEKVADLVREALRARDQHAYALGELRGEVAALRREVDRLNAQPAPLEAFDTEAGEAGWVGVKLGSALSCPHGRGVAVEHHPGPDGGAWLIAWTRGDPWLVRREDFMQQRVALVRPRG